MIEEGKVIEVIGPVARVELAPNSSCSSCSMADLCHLTREGLRTIEAETIAGVYSGSRVRVELKRGQLLKGSILIFVIPAFSFVIGAVVGQALSSKLWASIGMGFGFLGATYLALHLVDRRLAARTRQARVVELCD